MANLLDYLDWRGDLTLAQAPFNEVDNLILAELSFVNFGGIVPPPGEGSGVPLRQAAEAFFAKFSADEPIEMGVLVPDAIPDMLQKMASSELARCGLGLGARRYSPGYGDMSLEHQRIIFELLNMSEMGLSLTENCFMIPEKSVTSLAAVMAQNN